VSRWNANRNSPIYFRSQRQDIVNEINENLSNCTLTVTKEANINTEVYETEYDRPPSNAMFLRRKGFVHSKLIIKPQIVNDRSLKIRNPMTQKRAETEIRRTKGFKQRNNKRRVEHLNGGPPNKRFKSNVTLNEAVAEILYAEPLPFDTIRKKITSRSTLNFNIDQLQHTLDKMATFKQQNNCYYLKKAFQANVNWKNSSILTQSEKQKIIARSQRNVKNVKNGKNEQDEKKENNSNQHPKENGKGGNEPTEYMKKYGAICNQNTYTKYNALYDEKFNKMTTYLKCVTENTAYFKRMRAMIIAETDSIKQNKMKQEFRKIFEARKMNINSMKKEAAKLEIECNAIKQRMDVYTKELQQQSLQNDK